MKRRTPDYYHRFECIGSACRDNCCVGWEIDIDDEAYGDYCSVQGAFGQRLMEYIDHRRPYHFIMEGDRCPFLNTRNLCDIYMNLGKDRLCQICTDHPRFYETYGDRLEAGLGLVCEEAARLILNNKDKLLFIDEGEGQEEAEDPWLQMLNQVREQVILLLQERKRPLWERLALVLSQAMILQEDYSRQDKKSMSAHIHRQWTVERPHEDPADVKGWFLDCIEFLQSLELLTDQWEKILDLAYDKVREENIVFSDPDPIFYEQLLIYFVYRYFLRSVYDFQLLDKIRFAIFSCLAVRVLETAVSDQENIPPKEIARLYSKEIEYSEENMEALNEEFLFSEMFEKQKLLNAVSIVF